MNCPICDQRVNSSSGMCASCNEDAGASSGGGGGSMLSPLLGLLALGGVVAAAMSGGALPIPGAAGGYAGFWDGDRFTIISGDEEDFFEFDAGEPGEVSGYVYFQTSGELWDEMGAATTLHYLPSEKNDEVVRLYGGTKQCPASYYNKHMIPLKLIPLDEAQAEALRAIPFEQFVPLRVEGSPLTLAAAQRKGMETRYDLKGSRLQFMQPTMVELGEHQVILE